jgi:hypothetical protein
VFAVINNMAVPAKHVLRVISAASQVTAKAVTVTDTEFWADI